MRRSPLRHRREKIGKEASTPRLKQDLRACRMLRFGIVLLITALPLLGMEAMSTRRETSKQVFDSAAEALNACQSWRLREGQFSALIPAAAPVWT